MMPDWFWTASHRIIFQRMVAMLGAGKSLDVGVLAQELTANRELESIGGLQFLSELSSAVPTTAGLKDYLHRVRDLFVVRSVLKEGLNLVDGCKSYRGEGLSELLDGPVGRILSLTAASDAKDEPRWPLIVSEALKAAETIIKARELPPETIVRWPWKEMDYLFEPMQRGQLVVLGARPSVGKSSLARQIISHAANNGVKVYLDTLEVRPLQVALQIAAEVSGVGLRDLARAHPGDQNLFKQKLSDLEKAGIVPSSRDRSLARVVARLKALHASGKVDLAVIDHGGLLEDVALAGSKDEKMQGIGRITKTLKLLAGELNIVIILVWQLNRLSANEQNREPRMSDLRDSGSLEEDADKVILIHRPSEDPKSGKAQPEASDKDEIPSFFQNVIQAKGRDDGTSLMSFRFVRRITKFVPISETARQGSPQPEQSRLPHGD